MESLKGLAERLKIKEEDSIFKRVLEDFIFIVGEMMINVSNCRRITPIHPGRLKYNALPKEVIDSWVFF